MTLPYTKKFEAIGTHWHVEFEFDPSETDAALLMGAVYARIDQFDKDYSRFRTDSLVTEIAKAPGTYRMPDDAEPMLGLYQELYRQTEGAFTPLIGSALAEAGYDAEYSLVPKEMHAVPTLQNAFTFEPPHLTTHQPVLLDIGAAGKGYLVDIVAQLLLDNGATAYIVDAGGDIAVYSENNTPIQIGLEDPSDRSQAIGIATITNRSICGSSGNRRTWGDFHHIIDPHTLTSPRDVLAVWVVAKTTMLADALATCLYLVPSNNLTPHHSFEHLLVRADHSIEQSANFPAEVFTDELEPTYEKTNVLS